MNEKHHEMVLEKMHASGLEEWHCPTCGRRFLVQWPPAYKTIILEPGDRDTRHSLVPGGAHRGPVQVAEAEDTVLIEEFRLIPWLKWMEEVNFDSWWGENV
jgi:hypothetical protein